MGKRSRSQDEPEETGEEPVSEEFEEPKPTTEETPVDSEEAGEGHESHPEGEHPEGDDSGRRARVMRFAKRLMDRRELTTDTREILGSVLATSDKAKNEAVRMVAREVRSYLDALELKEDVKELITSYSLEISLSLKPLAEAGGGRASRHAEAPEPEPAEASEED